MLEEAIIGLLVLLIGLVLYMLNSNKTNDDYDLRLIKELSVEIKDKITGRNELDFANITKAKETSEKEVIRLSDNVKKLSELVQKEREDRKEAYSTVGSEIEKLVEQYKKLEKAENELKNTLKGDLHTRGRWGEIELERIFELSNMTDHISYITQIKTKGLQPDFAVKLPDRKQIVIDSKTSSKIFETYDMEDEKESKEYAQNVSESIKNMVKDLSKKEYTKNLTDEAGNPVSPDFVIMFLPGESMLQLALVGDKKGTLWADSVEKNVILASPYILLALLKTIYLSWRQDARTRKADEILLITKTIAERYEILMKYIKELRGEIGDVGKKYNQIVGSYNQNLEPAIRKVKQLSGENPADAPKLETFDTVLKEVKKNRD
jgi:DNA recombination protein RmuC